MKNVVLPVVLILGAVLFPATCHAVNSPLIWNTFMGGSGGDWAHGIAVDNAGNSYITGTSISSWGDPLYPHSGCNDAFVAKFDAGGVLQWHTFLGGSADDDGNDIAVDINGNIYVVGTSHSSWGDPLQPFAGSQNAFVAKFAANGTLQWNTFLGLTESDIGKEIAIDSVGNIYMIGAHYVAKLDANGTLQWHNPIAWEPEAIAVDNHGNICVIEYYDKCWDGCIDPQDMISVYKFNSDGVGNVIYTFSLDGLMSVGDMAVDSNGNIYLTGSNTNYLSVGKLDLGKGDGFEWFTRLYMNIDHSYDLATGIALDCSGNIYVVGNSVSTWGNPLNPFYGESDAFLAKLNASNGALLWNTFMGGAGNDYGNNITVDKLGNIYVLGGSNSSWGNPLYPYSGGSGDAFLAKLNNFMVTSPNGGESWTFNSLQDITWNAPGLAGNVALSLYRNGSRIGWIANCPASRGFYTWKAGTYEENLLPVPAGSGYAIQVTGSGNSDMSDGTFSIYKPIPSLELTSPKGGESWRFKSQQYITWKASGMTGNVALSLYRNGRKVGWIANCPATRGSYSWKVGTYEDALIPVPAGSGYSIVITRPGLAAASPGTFTIFRP